MWLFHNSFLFLIVELLKLIFLRVEKLKDHGEINTDENIPEILILCVVLAEDHRFFKHAGVDFVGVLRAVYVFVFYRKIEGASTIEQQFVRTVTGLKEMTLRRKLKEWVLAYSVSKHWDKHQIVCRYLNSAYFGWNMNNIKQLSHRLGLNLVNLTSSEAAFIAALLKYPLPEKPTTRRQKQIHTRQLHILKLLKKSKDEIKCLRMSSQIG